MTSTTDIALPENERPAGYLHNRWIDFLCLGGGSLPVLCLLIWLPAEIFQPYVIATILLLSHFINNPHFMHSYQIFYEDFGRKAAPGQTLRARYLFAGIGVPVLMIAYFAWCVVTNDPTMLGVAVNVMLFTVGWHYVKQGYGILIVESVLKRAFFSDNEKLWLRMNALSVWLLSWVMANRYLGENEFYGLQYVTVGIPDPVYWMVVILSTGLGLGVVMMFFRRAMRATLPLNGILAYLTSAYVWLVLSQVEYMMLAAVPLFHSLQYLAVVWRYRLNKESAEAEPGTIQVLGFLQMTRPRAAMARFVTFGIVLSAVWFWVVPMALDLAINHRQDLFGDTMFVFMFVIFINVHHYFLDNVMWRRDNADVKQHLFS